MKQSGAFRVGLIGASGTGVQRARALRRIEFARLVAVADDDRKSAEELARGCPEARVLEPEALAEDPDVDAVVFTTPPGKREALGLACLRSGKHVLCETPLAGSVEVCEKLARAATESGRCLATGFMLRHSPAARLARRLVDDGAIGRLDHVRAFHGHNGVEYFGPQWTLDSKVSGGGTLMSGGNHMIDQVRWFLGDVQEAVGFGTEHVWRQPGCEDNGFLLLRTESGHIGRVHASWTEWRRYRYCVEIYGTEGYVRFGFSPLWLVYARGKPGGRMRTRRCFFPVFQILERVRGWQWSLTNMYETDIRGWLEAARNGTEAPGSARDGIEAVRLAHAVTRLPG